MNTNKHGLKRPLLQIGVFMISFPIVSMLCGCVYALHGYNAPSDQTLKIISDSPQKYILRMDDGFGDQHKDYSVGGDGIVRFKVPSLPRGCAVRLFGVLQVADHRSEDMRAIELLKGGKSIRKFSLDDIAKLKLDSSGIPSVKIK